MGEREILISTGIPVGIAAVVLGLLWLVLPRVLTKKKAWEGAGPRWALPVLAGGLTLFGAYAWQTQVELWPQAATHRFPALGLLAAVAGLIAWVPIVSRRWWTVSPVAAVAGGLAAWMFLSTVHPSFLSETQRWVWVGVIGLSTGLNGWALERASERLKGWRGPALLWALIGTVGLGATAGFANAPLIVGGSAAAFGVLAGIGFVSGKVSAARGGGMAAAVLIAGLVTFANWLGDTERWVMLGLLLAAPAGVVGVILLWNPLKLKDRKTLALLVAAVPALGLAGTQAAITVPGLIEATSGGGEYYLDY
ncbi:MAG: hypothetical protein AAF297_02240 [Planctomycetota bacterium]